MFDPHHTYCGHLTTTVLSSDQWELARGQLALSTEPAVPPKDLLWGSTPYESTMVPWSNGYDTRFSTLKWRVQSPLGLPLRGSVV